MGAEVHMAEPTPKRGPSDATDYSSSKAPETNKEAEEREDHPTDPRLLPGGAHGAKRDPGMSSLDPAEAISGGRSTGQEDYGQPPANRSV
jgi:hypothetical protein